MNPPLNSVGEYLNWMNPPLNSVDEYLNWMNPPLNSVGEYLNWMNPPRRLKCLALPKVIRGYTDKTHLRGFQIL
ncbi:hypothetical protein [Nostoc sp. MG11]|uniref:hypothetical protein n=1 Tax=Nostoc sp. MG11 TaxID=2721166 RepID=UPI001D02C6E6|nr:hypothetical protein [Nostoc sp. MG11]